MIHFKNDIATSTVTVKLLSFITVLFIAWGCGKKAYMAAYQQPLTEGTLDAIAVQEDLDFLHRSIESIVPFTYLYGDSTAIANAFHEKQRIGQQDILQFYGNILELMGSYNASHFFVGFPNNQYRAQLKAEKEGVFPFTAH